MGVKAPPTRRVNHGSGHVYYVDDRKQDGITTLIGKGVPKPALINWAPRMSADFAIDHWDELLEMSPSERHKALAFAHRNVASDAAERGTLVHALVAHMTTGEELDVPEAFTGHVDAWLQFDHDWRPQVMLAEAMVINRRHRYAGTLDLVARLADGRTWLLDYKTGLKGVYPEAALQLSAYRYAETYLNARGEEMPMPAIDQAGAIELKADGYRLLPVQTDDLTFRTFLYVQQVAYFMDTGKFLIGDALSPPEAK